MQKNPIVPLQAFALSVVAVSTLASDSAHAQCSPPGSTHTLAMGGTSRSGDGSVTHIYYYYFVNDPENPCPAGCWYPNGLLNGSPLGGTVVDTLGSNNYVLRTGVIATSCTRLVTIKCGSDTGSVIGTYVIPGNGSCTNELDLFYGRFKPYLRKNMQPTKVRFGCVKSSCRATKGGVSGLLAGTVELFRYAHPTEIYRWKRAENESVIVDGPQSSGSIVSGANTAVLTISELGSADEGLYLLEASDDGGSTYHIADSVQLYVDRPVANMVQMPQDREACLGGTTEFRVIADEPSGVATMYRWYRDGNLLRDGEVAGVGFVSGAQTPLLTIDGLEATAAGQYSCQVLSDIYTNSTFDIALTISNNTSPPVVLEPPQDVTAALGTEAWMIADIEVAEGQMPSFQWRKNGIPIYDDGRIEGTETEQLVFNTVTTDDVGSYDCIITRGCASTTTAAATLTLPCPADYTGDTLVDILDFLDFFQDFGTCDQLPAPCGTLGNPDLNGDTIIDILDFLDFLDAFGNGC